jgi:hypothetical protein
LNTDSEEALLVRERVYEEKVARYEDECRRRDAGYESQMKRDQHERLTVWNIKEERLESLRIQLELRVCNPSLISFYSSHLPVDVDSMVYCTCRRSNSEYLKRQYLLNKLQPKIL